MSVLVIAECGVNHNGSEETAYKLIDAAVAVKANVAKFQLFRPEGDREQYKWLCLPLDAYPRLSNYCKGRGIKFACTAFDSESLNWLLKNTDMAFVKISSGEYANEALLKIADESGLRVIQSCFYGGAYNNTHDLLHVVPTYPTPANMANLKRVKEEWCSGLSDHSGDIFMSLAAVALGAQIIECHLTLDKHQDGPDHTSSLNPEQFKQMVRGIRCIEKAMA